MKPPLTELKLNDIDPKFSVHRHTDKGYLSFRDHLPVRRIIVGDTNRTGSEARYSVGALYCHGDSE